MYVYRCVHICIYTYVLSCTGTGHCMYIYTCMYKHIYTCIHTQYMHTGSVTAFTRSVTAFGMGMHAFVYTYVCIHIHIYVYTHTWGRMSLCTHICVYTYIYKYKHTPARITALCMGMEQDEGVEHAVGGEHLAHPLARRQRQSRNACV